MVNKCLSCINYTKCITDTEMKYTLKCVNSELAYMTAIKGYTWESTFNIDKITEQLLQLDFGVLSQSERKETLQLRKELNKKALPQKKLW